MKNDINRDRKEKHGPRWKEGKFTTAKGHIYIYSPDHPYITKMKYVLEHRLVMEAHIGRHLLPAEVVHHINGVKYNNRIENLMLYSSGAEHIRDHKLGVKRKPFTKQWRNKMRESRNNFVAKMRREGKNGKGCKK